MPIIELDSNNQPYYANPFGAPARPGETVQWKSISGRFSITIRDSLRFFSTKTGPALRNVEKIIVDTAVNGGLSETYTIISNLSTGTEIQYEVYCITNSDQGDAPPRIIITPAV
jgi:hypothetical protein